MMVDVAKVLILRSGPQGRVSRDATSHRVWCPSFETLATLAPQDDEVP